MEPSQFGASLVGMTLAAAVNAVRAGRRESCGDEGAEAAVTDKPFAEASGEYGVSDNGDGEGGIREDERHVTFSSPMEETIQVVSVAKERGSKDPGAS